MMAISTIAMARICLIVFKDCAKVPRAINNIKDMILFGEHLFTNKTKLIEIAIEDAKNRECIFRPSEANIEFRNVKPISNLL